MQTRPSSRLTSASRFGRDCRNSLRVPCACVHLDHVCVCLRVVLQQGSPAEDDTRAPSRVTPSDVEVPMQNEGDLKSAPGFVSSIPMPDINIRLRRGMGSTSALASTCVCVFQLGRVDLVTMTADYDRNWHCLGVRQRDWALANLLRPTSALGTRRHQALVRRRNPDYRHHTSQSTLGTETVQHNCAGRTTRSSSSTGSQSNPCVENQKENSNFAFSHSPQGHLAKRQQHGKALERVVVAAAADPREEGLVLQDGRRHEVRTLVERQATLVVNLHAGAAQNEQANQA